MHREARPGRSTDAGDCAAILHCRPRRVDAGGALCAAGPIRLAGYTKQRRNWSLTRMLHCPMRSPESFFNLFCGGTRKVSMRVEDEPLVATV